MVQLGGQFDAGAIEPRKAFDTLTAGWYPMQIVKSEWKTTQTGGSMLVLEFEMVETLAPQFKGRKVWARLNLGNTNAQTVEIAQRDLSAICRAVGVMVVNDTNALHHKPLAVKVKVRPAKGEYEESNETTGFDPIMARFPQGSGIAAPSAQAPSAPTMTAPAAKAGAAPAWVKR